MTVLPDWIAVDQVLDFVLPDKDPRDRAGIKAARRMAGAGFAETRYLDECQRAGIEVRWGNGVEVVDARCFVPGWAALVIESSIPKSAQCTKALRVGNINAEWRDAALSVWRLGGTEALAPWIQRTLRGVRTP